MFHRVFGTSPWPLIFLYYHGRCLACLQYVVLLQASSNLEVGKGCRMLRRFCLLPCLSERKNELMFWQMEFCMPSMILSSNIINTYSLYTRLQESIWTWINSSYSVEVLFNAWLNGTSWLRHQFRHHVFGGVYFTQVFYSFIVCCKCSFLLVFTSRLGSQSNLGAHFRGGLLFIKK